jgi:hypothetical protein
MPACRSGIIGALVIGCTVSGEAVAQQPSAPTATNKTSVKAKRNHSPRQKLERFQTVRFVGS